MMILADLTATFEHDSENGNYYLTYDSKALLLGFKVALMYDLAKAQFCFSGADSKLNNFLNLGGMEHGHMVGTYYFLSSCNFNK